jgi:hypothetical protein
MERVNRNLESQTTKSYYRKKRYISLLVSRKAQIYEDWIEPTYRYSIAI